MDVITYLLRLLMAPDINSEDFTAKLLGSVLIVIIIYLIRGVVIWVVNYEISNNDIRHQWKRTSSYVLFILAVILVGRIWLGGLQPLATFLGLVGAGIVVALQSPIINLAAWAFIVSRYPFKVGDRIEIGDHAGDVVDIGLFQFIILEIGN